MNKGSRAAAPMSKTFEQKWNQATLLLFLMVILIPLWRASCVGAGGRQSNARMAFVPALAR